MLNTSVDHVEAIFTRVDTADDSVVDADERLLCALSREQQAVEQLSLVHLVAWQADHRLFLLATLHVDSEMAILVAHTLFLRLGVFYLL